MRQRNLLHVVSIAWILVAVCSVRSQGQQDQIPKELALALIPFGGSDGGEIIVGQLPPDLATTFALPAAGRVLGSFVSLSYIQIVMAFPGTADSAQAFASRSLTEHGWVARERSISRMGGLQYGPRGTVPMTFCKTAAAGTSDAMTISTPVHGTGVTLLRLTRSAGSSACNQSPPNFVATSSSGSLIGTPTSDMAQRMAEMPLASVPPLWSPGDVRGSSQRCRTSNLTTGSQSQSQPLLTEMSMADVLAHYGRQLDSAGWKTAANESESATRTWSKAVPGRGTQEVTIRVSRMASQSGCYDVFLQASSLPR